MPRYDSAAELLPFSAKRPDRFAFEEYEPPADGRDRAIDHAPLSDEAQRPLFANRGYAHLKGR